MSHLQQRFRKRVERARRRAEREERERTAGSAKRAAVARTAALERRGGLRRFVREHGLSLVAVALFALSLAGQTIAGHRVYNDEQRQHGQPTTSIGAYVRSGAFLEATAENWESEFLQIGLFVLLTAFL